MSSSKYTGTHDHWRPAIVVSSKSWGRKPRLYLLARQSGSLAENFGHRWLGAIYGNVQRLCGCHREWEQQCQVSFETGAAIRNQTFVFTGLAAVSLASGQAKSRLSNNGKTRSRSKHNVVWPCNTSRLSLNCTCRDGLTTATHTLPQSAVCNTYLSRPFT